VLLSQDRPLPASCPDTIFVTGNNPAATEFRGVLTGSKYAKLAPKKDDAAAVLEVDLKEVTVSATLTLKSGELVWSGSATASDYPGVVVGLRRIMVVDLNKSMVLRACGRLIK
jgi:hypothetical protein